MLKLLTGGIFLAISISGSAIAGTCGPGIGGEYKINANGHNFWVRLTVTPKGYLIGDMFLSNATGPIEQVNGACNPDRGEVLSWIRYIEDEDSNGEVPIQRYAVTYMVDNQVRGTFTHYTPSLGTQTYTFYGYKNVR